MIRYACSNFEEHWNKRKDTADKTIVILECGFDGLFTAQRLCRVLPPEHRVIVVEKQDTFSLCAFNMRFMAETNGK